MLINRKETFYIIETVKDDGQYLCEVMEDTHELMIHHTTRNIHDKRLMRFDNASDAQKMAEAIKNDAFADEPRVLDVTTSLTVSEV